MENPESAPAADTLKGLVWPFAADIQQGILAAVTGGRETASPDAVIAPAGQGPRRVSAMIIRHGSGPGVEITAAG